jgi:hypothetical protein
MEENDRFKDWVQKRLNEEMNEVCFSEEARDKVRNRIKEQAIPKENWWNKQIAVSSRVVSFSVLFLIMLTVLYTRTFFYVTPQQVAKFENREKIVLHDGGVPFGAVQHLVASLENGKGVGRP